MLLTDHALTNGEGLRAPESPHGPSPLQKPPQRPEIPANPVVIPSNPPTPPKTTKTTTSGTLAAPGPAWCAHRWARLRPPVETHSARPPSPEPLRIETPESESARALRARGRPESCEFNTRTGYATHSRIPNQADMSAATPLDPQRIRNGKVTDLGAFGEYLVTNRMSAVRTYVAVYVYIYIYLYIYTYIHISKFGGCKRQDSLS